MSRNNTGNPIGSKAFPDFEDNVKNLDEAVNAEQDTFQDRLGKSRLTWAGIVKAGTGDAGVIVPIVQQAAQDAASAVIAGVAGQVAVAESAADRAETARDAAFVNADVYPDVATGRAAVANGEQFQVVEGDIIVRYRRNTSSTQTALARYPAAHYVNAVRYDVERVNSSLVASTNLATRIGELEGKVVAPNGDINDSDNYNVSDYIPVTPGQTYYTLAYYSMAEYAKDKTFLRRRDTTASGGASSVWSDAFWVRLNYQPSNANSDARRMNAGSTLLDYEPPGATLSEEVFVPQSSGEAGIGDGAVTPDKTSFVKTGANLFNWRDATEGFIVSTDGTVNESEAYSVSDYIRVEPGETYVRSGPGSAIFVSVAEYDEKQQFIRRVAFSTQSEPGDTYTVSGNTHYVRLNYTGPIDSDRMFSKGEEQVDYEDYYLEIESLKTQSSGSVLGFVDDRMMYDAPVEGIFDGAQEYTAWPNFDRDITTAEVYAQYDQLMSEFPGYISRQTLGEDDFGYTIYAYHLSPGRPQSTFGDLKRPKIFITSGIHGFEKATPLVCYLLFRDMLERWQTDPLLDALRHNADYIIIPVANPSGWDDYTRHNRNGVDINRNFPAGWTLGDPSSSTYGGPEPFSEPESQCIKLVLDEHPDISAVYDFHNFGGTSGSEDFIWIPTGQGRYVQHMASNLISSMTRKWRQEYPEWFPQDEEYFVGWTSASSGATLNVYATERGVPISSTFEVCRRWWLDPNTVPYDATHRRTAVEAWANWLLITLRELSRNL